MWISTDVRDAMARLKAEFARTPTVKRKHIGGQWAGSLVRAHSCSSHVELFEADVFKIPKPIVPLRIFVYNGFLLN